jgi:hypothetical protein
VDVWVDAARHNEFAAGVDDLRRLRQDAGRGETDDAFRLDADVPAPDAMRGDNLPAAYQQIQHAQWLSVLLQR